MYLTYSQAIAHLASIGVPIAEATLRRMVSHKRVPFTKLDKRVLFDIEALADWLKSRAVAPRRASI